MAGQINEQEFACAYAKVMLTNPDLKRMGIRFDEQPELVNILMFDMAYGEVLKKIVETFPSLSSVYYNYLTDKDRQLADPKDAHRAVFDKLCQKELLAEAVFVNDVRVANLFAATISNCFSENDRQLATQFFEIIENSSGIKGLFEIILLSSGMYAYNYGGIFRDLVKEQYEKFRDEGFGESVEEIKNQPIGRKRSLDGLSILAQECEVVDKMMDSQPTVEGSLDRWRQENGVNTWLNAFGNSEISWLNQHNEALWGLIHSGYKAMKDALTNEDNELFSSMRDIHKSILKLAHKTAEECNKPFDLTINGQIERAETKTVDVPYEVKVGLFKKETRYRQEYRTELYYSSETIKFNGWKLEHFERVEDDGDMTCWDYCLGSDGLLYVITTIKSRNGKTKYKVNEMLACFESRFNVGSQNIFLSVSHGWIGALDSVQNIPFEQRKYTIRSGDTEYILDFPLQLNNRNDYPFKNEGDGLRERLKKLCV